MEAIVFDRNGRRIVGRRIVPDGGRVSCRAVHGCAQRSRSARIRRRRAVLHRPGFAAAALTTVSRPRPSNQTLATRARPREQDYIERISNQWRQTWQQMPPSGTSRARACGYDPSDAEDADPSERAYIAEGPPLTTLAQPTCDDDPTTTPRAWRRLTCRTTSRQLPLAAAAGLLSRLQSALWRRTQTRTMSSAIKPDARPSPRSGQDGSMFEAIRTDAQRRYAERITNAWKT